MRRACDPFEQPISVRKKFLLFFFFCKDISLIQIYFNISSSKTAGTVEMSNQMQPQIHKTNAITERIGDSHSKQLLQMFYLQLNLFFCLNQYLFFAINLCAKSSTVLFSYIVYWFELTECIYTNQGSKQRLPSIVSHSARIIAV